MKYTVFDQSRESNDSQTTSQYELGYFHMTQATGAVPKGLN
jgi:hypothetical protein